MVSDDNKGERLVSALRSWAIGFWEEIGLFPGLSTPGQLSQAYR